MLYSQVFAQFEFFTGFFTNIFNILMAVIFALIGSIIGVFLSRYILKPKNQVLYCRERDGRGEEYNVKTERAVSLETDTNPELRFFKFGRAYEFRKRGRAFTRFFGKEGTAYTWRLEGFDKVKDADGKEVIRELNLAFPTLEQAIQFAWGEEDYNRTPDELKAKLKDKKILVTVNLEEGITPEGYAPITEEVINKDGDQKMAALVAEEIHEAKGKDWVMVIMIFVAGMGVMGILSKIFGWWA